MTRNEAIKVMQLNIAECEDTLCYSENKGIREQKEAFEIALEALQPWARTAERVPIEADGTKDGGQVWVWDTIDKEFSIMHWRTVAVDENCLYTWWASIPPLPKGEDDNV